MRLKLGHEGGHCGGQAEERRQGGQAEPEEGGHAPVSEHLAD